MADAPTLNQLREQIDSLDGQIGYFTGRLRSMPTPEMGQLIAGNIRERLDKMRALLATTPSPPVEVPSPQPPAAPLTPCPKCGAPCTTKVKMRGGDHGWGTTDAERTTYRYAQPQPPAAPLTDEQLETLNKPEPYGVRLTRLLNEASAGVSSDVSEADALEFRREQYDLTAGDYAAVLGMAQSHYSEVINQRRRLPVNSIARAVAIGVPIAPLLAGRGITTHKDAP